MSALQAIALAAAGLAADPASAMAGGASIITFPSCSRWACRR